MDVPSTLQLSALMLVILDVIKELLERADETIVEGDSVGLLQCCHSTMRVSKFHQRRTKRRILAELLTMRDHDNAQGIHGQEFLRRVWVSIVVLLLRQHSMVGVRRSAKARTLT